ncbi:MAG: DUF58 domain-containing protein [Anaerolineae bacterium]
MRNFIIFTLVLFALAALLRIDFFFTIFYLFMAVYVVSRFWARRVLKNLRITRRFPERAFLGERLTVTLTVENAGRLPVPWLLINEVFSSVLSSPPFFRRVFTLGGRARQTFEYDLTARRRGYYELGPLRVETGDLLGINRGLNGAVAPNPLIVYPKIVPMARLRLPAHSPQVVLPTPLPLFHDTSRIIGVKDYVPGENPRYIHWPATATHGRVLVKRFQTAIARDNAIFLDLNRAAYGRAGQANVAIELAVVVAASLAHAIVNREDLPVGLFAAGFDPLDGEVRYFAQPPNRGQAQLMTLLEILARVEGVDSAEDFAARVRQQSVHLPWGSTLVIITGAETADLLQTLLRLKKSGFKVALVLAQPAAYLYPKSTPSRVPGLPVYRITAEKDIEQWQPIP